MRCFICDFTPEGVPSLFQSGLAFPSKGSVKLRDGQPVCDTCSSAVYLSSDLLDGELPTLDGGFDLELV